MYLNLCSHLYMVMISMSFIQCKSLSDRRTWLISLFNNLIMKMKVVNMISHGRLGAIYQPYCSHRDNRSIIVQSAPQMSYDCSFGRLVQWGSAWCLVVIIPRRGYEVRNYEINQCQNHDVIMLLCIWCY